MTRQVLLFLNGFPEIAHLPLPYLLNPGAMTAMEQTFYGCQLGKDYPAPIVDIAVTGKQARTLIWAHKRHEQVRAEKKRILARHTIPRKKYETKKPAPQSD